MAVLDFTRWAFCARMKGETPAEFAKRREPPMDPNLSAYRRDPNMIAWLVSCTRLFLQDDDVTAALA